MHQQMAVAVELPPSPLPLVGAIARGIRPRAPLPQVINAMNEINTARRLREAATEKAEAERIMKVLDCLESPLALYCSRPALLMPQFALVYIHGATPAKRQATICRIGNRWSVPAASRHLRTCACVDMHGKSV